MSLLVCIIPCALSQAFPESILEEEIDPVVKEVLDRSKGSTEKDQSSRVTTPA